MGKKGTLVVWETANNLEWKGHLSVQEKTGEGSRVD